MSGLKTINNAGCNDEMYEQYLLMIAYSFLLVEVSYSTVGLRPACNS